MKYSTDIVVIDLEATCLEQDQNEVPNTCIIEIGAVRLNKRTLEVVDSFQELVNPRDCPITPYITAVTNITPEMVAHCDRFDKVAARFTQWYGPRNRAILAAFGVYYDIPLLRKEWKTFGLDYKACFAGGALDVRALALAWLANNKKSTTGVTVEKTLERMNITLDLKFHRALDDALATAAILQFFHLGEVHI